ncbi:gap junction delta-3 protein-like [Brachyhypopomus gauderio]|uniref:gap junction delta-3 protein-like n=1 Tax=Brachyhypopomus gauderio TaxID=698409 RepID=UPI004041DF06
MTDWGFLSDLLGSLPAHSPMLGRLWLLLLLLFRMLVLGTVASDLFGDEQDEFSCNTLQPGCKQVCYDHAFPISQYRFWVFHIVLISTPAVVFLMYAMHHHRKDQAPTHGSTTSIAAANQSRHRLRLKRLYMVNVGFRLFSELGFLIGQCRLYGFRVEAQFPCSRFPCPHTVDCFTSRPMEKTVFLVFYFVVGVLSAFASLAELVHVAWKRGMACQDSLERQEDVEAWSGQEEGCFSPSVQKLSREGHGKRVKRTLLPLGRRGRNTRRSKGRRVISKASMRLCSFGPRDLGGGGSQKSASLLV